MKANGFPTHILHSFCGVKCFLHAKTNCKLPFVTDFSLNLTVTLKIWVAK